MNAERKAVVMAWERPLMEANARAVCQGGGKVLNLGFGMGAWGSRTKPYRGTSPRSTPSSRPTRRCTSGCSSSDGARRRTSEIVFGRWQDIMRQLGSYDVIT
ncbi:ankyrin repeat family protein [Zea mays]|uniref:Ankyrin repeat family protein n=1 Tax=Zea mays TaxID=4577 RepID=A0A1D6L5J7_MAIZE|nr:ankyrin repeat family protein [Zea mays]